MILSPCNSYLCACKFIVKTLCCLLFYSFFFLVLSGEIFGQSFDPGAGISGSLAIPHDSPKIRTWASRVLHFDRGPRKINDISRGFASTGTEENVLGPALTNGILSLGDGGSIIVSFPSPISDGPGPDIAVFENGFSNGFLEFATVEVSSNGKDFFRFPAVSEIQTENQTGPFDTLDARRVHNLAGKYRAGFGTGFDLAELGSQPGLDIHSITEVRIRDVVGSLDSAFGTFDSNGTFINDPWPTDFESGGFDLDAIAGLNLSEGDFPIVWPSVLMAGDKFQVISSDTNAPILLLGISGKLIAEFPSGGQSLQIPSWVLPGIYFVREKNQAKSRKILILQ